ncbi:serine/threonine protein phosphatase 1 [Pacificibacter maritimus]|uniref:Serine/threonine protein phosphatase 1 n=1 Tax=Pacificibacter maritimus TaxID=762213 RepID=A0A3N4UC98_9RHOB|nr:metallophosphoesterase [Pacificibacter maritimus]RPE62927.1 serine/threonine protein phosphatase 1 [Pacificibacter maritimus]
MSKSHHSQNTPVRKILRLADMPAAIYAIGDIHGCLALYDALEKEIVADAAAFDGPKLIICLGDVVDRGPNTSGTLDRLMGPAPEGFERLVLRGNHEDMMASFITAPERMMEWLDFGGEEALASYGIRPNTSSGFRAERKLLRHKLRTGIPAEHLNFINDMPLALEVGHLRFAHAGYALAKPAQKQLSDFLLWGPPSRVDSHSGDEILIHGHVIVDDIEVQKNRINLDLGAYKSGRLAAMRFTAIKGENKVIEVTKSKL